MSLASQLFDIGCNLAFLSPLSHLLLSHDRVVKALLDLELTLSKLLAYITKVFDSDDW